MEEKLSPEEWGARYASTQSQYVEFARRLAAVLTDLVRAERVDIVQIESRAKTIASVVEKIKRKRSEDDDPLGSITDLTGLRVITYYLEDVVAVGDIVKREFDVDWDNSLDKADDLALDQFGYRSDHFVASLSTARASLSEWKPFSGLKFEVQIRTVLQHAWAAVSHKIEYKSAEAAPEQVRRRLHRLSALFEIADEQFSTLRDERAAQDEAYKEDVARGNLDVPLDASSYAAFLGITGTGEKIRNLLHAAGFRTETLVPVVEDRLSRDRKDLISVLRKNEINSLKKISDYLGDVKRMTWLAEGVARMTSEQDGGKMLNSSFDDILTQILLLDPNLSFVEGIYNSDWDVLLRSARAKIADSDTS